MRSLSRACHGEGAASRAHIDEKISVDGGQAAEAPIRTGEHVTTDQARNHGLGVENIRESALEEAHQSPQVTRQVTAGPKSASPARRKAAAARPPASRSVAANDPRRLAGVNGGSAAGRRFRDLVEALSSELGHEVGEAERLMVRNAASLQLHIEDLAAKHARGGSVDPDAFTRAANAATRAIAALRKRKPAKRRGEAMAAFLEDRRRGEQ